MTKLQPVCPYCAADAELVTGADIYPHRPDLHRLRFWRCLPCDAYVGCHKPGLGHGDGTLPLGRLANAKLRAAKQAAHAAVDRYWLRGRMRRSEVYATLAVHMGLPKSATHIGLFDEAQCAEVVAIGRNEALWRNG